MAHETLGHNDIILLVSLAYSAFDLFCEWQAFSGCRHPIHMWLLVSYVTVILFRVVQFVGQRAATAAADARAGPGGDFLLDLRQKGALGKVMVAITWFVCLPFFVIWTVIGTYWMWDILLETPQCLPTATHMWFSVFWLALCYLWIIIHVALGVAAWILERRIRSAEGDLAQIEDADVLARWGQVSQLAGYQSLCGFPSKGLTPSEIAALPSGTVGEMDWADEEDCVDEDEYEAAECSICLNELKPGETIRGLTVCGHTFHRSCIDLWLLRRADCPLCKRDVRASITSSREASREAPSLIV